MVRVLIEQLLGAWGTALLDFYDANSLAINLAVVLYGGLVVLSWMNLKGIRRQLVGDLAEQLRKLPDLEAGTPPKKALRKVKISWEKAIEKRRFPFVAQQTSFLPRKTTLEILQGLLPEEELADDAIKMVKEGRAAKR